MMEAHFHQPHPNIRMHVQCPSCQLQIKVTERLYGRKVSCKCGTVIRMPAGPAGNTASQPTPAMPVAATPVPAAPVSAVPIRFNCPSCQQQLEVEGQYAGKVTQCPCGTRIKIPAASTTPANDPFADPLSGYTDGTGYADPFADPLGDPSAMMAPLPNQSPYTTGKPKKKRTAKKKKPARRGSRADVQQVIDGQKLLIYSILGNMLLLVFLIGFSFIIGPVLVAVGGLNENGEPPDWLFMATGLFYIGAYIALIVMMIRGIAMIGQVVIGSAWVILVLLLFFPCISLVVLLGVNSRATGYLQAKGVEVGFLGAK